MFTASFNAEQDSDGTIRNASMFFRTGNLSGTSFVPSLALQTYLLATGYQARIDIGIDPKNSEQKKILKFEIVDTRKDPEQVIGDIVADHTGEHVVCSFKGSEVF